MGNPVERWIRLPYAWGFECELSLAQDRLLALLRRAPCPDRPIGGQPVSTLPARTTVQPLSSWEASERQRRIDAAECRQVADVLIAIRAREAEQRLARMQAARAARMAQKAREDVAQRPQLGRTGRPVLRALTRPVAGSMARPSRAAVTAAQRVVAESASRA
jgi:hypothetical protein